MFPFKLSLIKNHTTIKIVDTLYIIYFDLKCDNINNEVLFNRLLLLYYKTTLIYLNRLFVQICFINRNLIFKLIKITTVVRMKKFN